MNLIEIIVSIVLYIYLLKRQTDKADEIYKYFNKKILDLKYYETELRIRTDQIKGLRKAIDELKVQNHNLRNKYASLRRDFLLSGIFVKDENKP